MRVERVALKDHRDVAISRGDVVHDTVADRDHAFRDVLETGDHPQRRRLAGSRRADEDHELPVGHVQVKAGDGARAVWVDLGDVVKANAGQDCSSLS
jgi:hypothetical protein